MSFKSSSFLLVICFSLLFVPSFVSSSSPTTSTATISVHEWDSWEGKGEKLVLPYYHKIKDVKNNKRVQAIGKFVVDLVNRKHSKDAHPLVFSEVTIGEMADFAGDYYYYNLTVSTSTENKVTKMFVTIVAIPKSAEIGPVKVVSFEPLSSTKKREVALGRPGGIMEIKDVKHKKEAQEKGNFAVKEYNDKHKNGFPLTFLEVVEGRYQVVAGIKYYLTISATQNGVQKLFSAVVVSPAMPYHVPDELISFTALYTSSPVVGGIMEIKDVKHNKEAQEKGNFAVKEYNGKHKNGSPLTFLEVIKGEYQVVAGFKYYLTISATQNDVKKLFYATVLSPATPYNTPDELISFTPLPPSSSPPILGKRVLIKDVKRNKKAQELGKFAVEEYNGRSKNKNPLKFVEVVRGEYQVVAGVKYTLVISVIKEGVKDSAHATILVKPGPSAEKELISFFLKVHKHN